MNRIDPDGRDDYRLDRDGNIYLEKKTDADNHTIYATNSKGAIDKKNSIGVDKYVLDIKETVSGVKTVASDGTQNDATVSIYTSLGDEKSTQLFEFLSNNSDVEWSQTKTTTNGNEVNYITTVNWDGGEPGQTMVADRIINQNNMIRANNSILGIQSPVIREVNHNHPNGNRTVSVGDVNVATMTQTAFPNTKFHNYTKQYGYTPYNMFTEPAILQEVIIYGKKR